MASVTPANKKFFTALDIAGLSLDVLRDLNTATGAEHCTECDRRPPKAEAANLQHDDAANNQRKGSEDEQRAFLHRLFLAQARAQEKACFMAILRVTPKFRAQFPSFAALQRHTKAQAQE
jgi:hypothetical protein